MAAIPRRFVNDGRRRYVVRRKDIRPVLKKHRYVTLRKAANRWRLILRQRRWWPISGIQPRPRRYPRRSGTQFVMRVRPDFISIQHPYDYPIYVDRNGGYLERSYNYNIEPYINNVLIRQQGKKISRELCLESIRR